MSLNHVELIGMVLGGLVTAALFAMNICSLIRGRRIFRGPRSCRLKMM
ncbi:MAG: hypothetical protein J6B95_01785 [Oscillospiraceae bacterium]|nr:hypothetical protein [Oscillospiraceae bacterium]